MNDAGLTFIPPVGHPSLHGMLLAGGVALAFCLFAAIVDRSKI